MTPHEHREIHPPQKSPKNALAWLIACACIFNALATWGAELPRDPEADWLKRASAPGVVLAVGFDDIGDWVRYQWDRSHCNPAYQVLVDGNREGCRANAWDPSVKASGKGAVRFDILTRTGEGGGGSLAIPFGDYETHQFGANTDMWVSWRQRMSPRFLQPYREIGDRGRATAFKQIIIGQGDMDATASGKLIVGAACSEAELVVVSTYPHLSAPYPQAYIECARYNPFEQLLTKGMFSGEAGGSLPRTRQNMRFDGAGQSNCIYHPATLDSSGCVRYRADEWITYMVHVAIGPEGSAVSSVSRREQPGYVDSTYEFYVAYAGQDFELVHRQEGVVIPRGQYYSAGDPELASSYGGGWGPSDAHPKAKYGKLWLLPYMTAKDPEETSALASTWFDEVIVSRCRVAAPGYPIADACETRSAIDAPVIAGALYPGATGMVRLPAATVDKTQIDKFTPRCCINRADAVQATTAGLVRVAYTAQPAAPDHNAANQTGSDASRLDIVGGHGEACIDCADGAESVGAATNAATTIAWLGVGDPEPARIEIPPPGKEVPRSVDARISGDDLLARIRALTAGHWLEVPGSEMARVQVDACGSPEIRKAYAPVMVNPAGCDPDVAMAYSGGAYDTRRHRLIVWGGGHTGYMGNEIYAFDVPQARWLRLTEPSAPVIETRYNKSQARWDKLAQPWHQDGSAPAPISVHTYDQLEYLPQQDALFSAGGATYSGSGYASALTWLFDLSKSRWRRVQSMPGKAYGLFEYNMSTAYDAMSKQVLLRGYTRAGAYDPVSDTWTISRNPLLSRRLGTVGELDPKRRIFLVSGGGKSETHTVSATGELGTAVEFETQGDREIEDCYAPGLVYSPTADRFVAWCNGGDIYTLDMSRATWTRHAPPSGAPVPGDPTNTPGMRGTYGRFRYMPEYDAFIVMSGNRSNIFIYRLPPAN